MKYYIVKENSNYGDEFDLQAFKLYQAESTELLKNRLCPLNINFPLELYFGTNETMIYKNKEDLFKDLKFKEITEQEYNIIIKVIGDEFGLGAILGKFDDDE